MSVKYDEYFTKASQTYNVDKNLLIAVATTESGIDQNAVSKAGAVGVMQIMPSTARDLGLSDIHTAESNIMGGAQYLSMLLNEFGGDMELALSAYNAGPNAVKKNGGVVESTQGYVDKVMTTYKGGSWKDSIVKSSNSYDLIWWGDIVRVVAILLLIVLIIVFVYLTANQSLSESKKELGKEIIGSMVKGGDVGGDK